MSDGAFLVYTDGACRGNPGPASIGVSIERPRGTEVATLSEVIGETTNNVAEYTALLRALEELDSLGATQVDLRLDSELIVKQIKGEYRVKSEKLKKLFWDVSVALDKLDSYTIRHIPRDENKRADALANMALDRDPA